MFTHSTYIFVKNPDNLKVGYQQILVIVKNCEMLRDKILFFCVQMTSLEFGPLLGKVRVSVPMNPVLKQICRQWWISWYIFFFLCLAPCWEVKEKVFLWRAWMEGLKQKRNQQNGRWAAASWSRCRHNSSSEQKPSQTEPAEMFE